MRTPLPCQRCAERLYGKRPCPACGKLPPLGPLPARPNRKLPKGHHHPKPGNR
jgi:hypothetical protein